MGIAQGNGFAGQLGEGVPLAGEEGVEAEEGEGLDRHRHCAARSAVMARP